MAGLPFGWLARLAMLGRDPKLQRLYEEFQYFAYPYILWLMARQSNWENQIGRRLRLRDLHVLFTVAERGSMAKAAVELGISQPAVTNVIANLEHALGVRLFDRGPHGVDLTIYGQALLKRSIAAFDELKQGVRDIEFLSDPMAGELRIGSGHTVAAAVLPPILQQFSLQYPRVVIRVDELPPATREHSRLRDRTYDLILGRLPPPDAGYEDDLNMEPLYDDSFVVTAGVHSRWAQRRRVELEELIEEPWMLPPATTWNYMRVAEAFRARHLDMPKIRLVTDSMHIRTHLVANGPFLTALARSVAHKYGFKVLPVDLPPQTLSVAIITLKNRTLSPVVDLFIQHIRNFTRPLRGESRKVRTP